MQDPQGDPSRDTPQPPPTGDPDVDFEDDEEEQDNMGLEAGRVQKLLSVPFFVLIALVSLCIASVPLMFLYTMVMRIIHPDQE